MTSQEAPSAASGPLLLADISGYTWFLQSVAVAHQDDAFADGAVPDAYAILSDLLDGIGGERGTAVHIVGARGGRGLRICNQP